MVFSHHTAEEFAADPAPLGVGMHQQIVNVCRHLTVVKHGDQTAQTVCFPGGVHRRKSAHRTRQPLRILRRLPIDGSKKRLQLFLRDIFSVRVFDQSYFSLFLRKAATRFESHTSAPCLFCMAKSLRVSKHIGRNARSERRQRGPNRTRDGSMSVLYGKITVCCQICVHRPQCTFRTERLPAPEDNNQKRRGLQLATRVRV